MVLVLYRVICTFGIIIHNVKYYLLQKNLGIFE